MPETAEQRPPSGGEATSPAPARVPAGRWSELPVPELGSLSASATVSVVVAGAGRPDAVPGALAALSVASYPRELLEVVLAKEAADFHTEASLTDAAAGLAVKVAAAGEDPAEHARGEILVFLAPGEIPDPALPEAHARWHHAVSDAVTVGVRRPLADGAEPDPPEIARAARERSLAELLRDRLGPEDEALETFLELTRGLSERRQELFPAAARQNVALRAETYRAVGGGGGISPEPLARLDLAYRLDLHGALFVPEREAQSYGGAADGAWPLPGESGGAADDPRAASLIPVRGFRPERTGRVFERPAMVVELDAAEESADDLLETVDAVLRGRFSDLELRVSVPAEHPARERIEAALRDDPRVVVGPHARELPADSPYRVSLPAVAVPDERTFEDLHGLIREEGVGALHVTVGAGGGLRARARATGRTVAQLPRRLRREASHERRRRVRRAQVRVVASGTLARSRRVAARTGDGETAILEELFGVRWVDGAGIGFRLRGMPAPEHSEYAPLAPATDLARERAEHLRQRARAHTNQARAERHAQHAVREKMRASQEKARADHLAAGLARVSPAYWVSWRSGRLLQRLLAIPRRIAKRAYGVRPVLVRRAVPVVDRWRRMTARTGTRGRF